MLQFEYYNREKKVVCIGTFVQVTDKTILEKNQMFIVPPDNKGHNGKAGCCEGRQNSGYNLPIALFIKYIADSHITPTKNGGSWLKERCFIEIE